MLKGNNKYEQKPQKILGKENTFDKVADPQPATLSRKMNPITDPLQVICVHRRSWCFKVDLKEDSSDFEI